MFMKSEMNEIMGEHIHLLEKTNEKHETGKLVGVDPELERAATKIKNLIDARDLVIFAKGTMVGAFLVIGASIAAYLLGLYY